MREMTDAELLHLLYDYKARIWVKPHSVSVKWQTTHEYEAVQSVPLNLFFRFKLNGWICPMSLSSYALTMEGARIADEQNNA